MLMRLSAKLRCKRRPRVFRVEWRAEFTLAREERLEAVLTRERRISFHESAPRSARRVDTGQGRKKEAEKESEPCRRVSRGINFA